MDTLPPDRIDAFIARWNGTEQAERANYVTFLNELCDLLTVERPASGQWRSRRLPV